MIDEEIAEVIIKMDTLEVTDPNGKPLGGKWSIKSTDKLAVDIFEKRN